ncbi:MAG: glutamate racemase [Christensenellales bacterium]
MSELPVGFFDSGVGGLSVLREAIRVLPRENFIYYGDNKHAPYGTKGEQEIRELTFRGVGFLLEQGVKAIVVACNTATSVAVEDLRAAYPDIPVISMEPAVKPALALIQEDGWVLMMATPATISQKRYVSLLEHMYHGDRVINLACPGLPELVEQGQVDSPVILDYLAEKFQPLRDKKVQAVVLGCTHYVFAERSIARMAREVWGEAPVIHGHHGTVLQLKRVLQQRSMEAFHGGAVRYCSSGDDLSAYRTLMQLDLE